MIKKIHYFNFILISIITFSIGWLFADTAVFAKEPIIIVIDPGHGGENLGAQYENFTEKEMTMIVARTMKEELEKYENVVVYLTHETDLDMSLKERAVFAKEKQADFLFCLHFNSSVHHNLYGAEVWIPAYSDYYVKGRQFAEIQMQLFSKHGLYSRGIKTKLNDKGEDYYGILRHCSAVGVPSALIEHCHMDHDNDKPFYQQSEEQLRDFGRLDAEAVAKYFGLKSSEKSVNYSTYPKVQVEIPKAGEAVKPDKTEPEMCDLEVLSIEDKTAKVMAKIEAADADSYILYYAYSLDGGNTYSELCKWPRPFWNQSDHSLILELTVPYEQENDLRVKVYNGFDVWTESNVIPLPVLSDPKREGEIPEKEMLEEFAVELPSNVMQDQTDRMILIGMILLLSFFIVLILYVMVKMILRLSRNSKQRKKV